MNESPSPNPYSAPNTEIQPSPEGLKNYPGVKRVTYWIVMTLVNGFYMAAVLSIFVAVFWAFANGTLDPNYEPPPPGPVNFDSVSAVIFWVGFALTIAGLAVFVQRIRNTGKSGWWALTGLIPIWNIWVAIVAAAAPSGFHHTQKFDRAGKVLTWIMVILTVLSLVLLIPLLVMG